MKMKHRLAAMAGLALCAISSMSLAGHGDGYGDDDIYIGETSNDTIQRCDIERGNCQTLVQSQAGGLRGPRGMFFSGSRLWVVNQNVNQPASGEVLSFNGRTGELAGKIVSSSDPNPPFAPRGMVRGGPGNSIYVAEFGLETGPCADGHIRKYDGRTHAWLRDLSIEGFVADGKPGFHPRGLVFGPDGYLYVTAFGCPTSVGAEYDPEAGYVLRFDPRTDKFDKRIVSNLKGAPLLHRPEGIMFDRKGNLWVTSFRKNSGDKTQLDGLLKIDVSHETQSGFIPLGRSEYDDLMHYRTSAQVIVQGPDGDIFAPIARGPTVQTPGGYTISPVQGQGELWRCSPESGRCRTVARGGALTNPWYAIFRFSDPATLEYTDD